MQCMSKAQSGTHSLGDINDLCIGSDAKLIVAVVDLLLLWAYIV